MCQINVLKMSYKLKIKLICNLYLYVETMTSSLGFY